MKKEVGYYIPPQNFVTGPLEVPSYISLLNLTLPFRWSLEPTKLRITQQITTGIGVITLLTLLSAQEFASAED